MMKRAVLLLLLLAAPACAGNSVSSISVKLGRSLTSVAVKAIVSGDDDSSAVLRIFQRHQHSDPVDSGMLMVRRPGTNIHEGRILYMQQGRTYLYRIEASDGGTVTYTNEDTVSCAEVRPTVATGPVYYVNKATGSSGNSGLTPALAKATINQALDALKASADSGAYGGVIVAPGEYHERVDLTFGGDGKPRFLSGDRTNRDSTIICGANEWGEAGKRDNAGTNIGTWTAIGYASTYPTTAGVYKVLFPSATGAYGDSIGSVIIGWGEYLHRKTSLLAIFADSTGLAVDGSKAAGGENSGWFWAGETLYVRRANNSDPTGSVFHFGYRTNLVEVGRRNWSVRNLTVRYAGGPFVNTSASALEDPGTNGNGIVAGQRGGNSSGMVVDSCRFYGNMGLSVYAAYASASVRCDSATIANSSTDGLTIGSMTYTDAKARLEEDASIFKVTGPLSNVYGCTVTETHNGIQTGPSAGSSDSTWGSGTEVYGNTVTKTSDDAIEVDTGHAINELVMANTTDYTGSGISVTPIYTGPAFVFYNTFSRFKQAGLKVGNDGNGSALVYQNTFASRQPNGRPLEGSSGGYWVNFTFANNIFMGGSYTLAGPSAADSAEVTGVTFNYNLVDTSKAGRLATWGGVAHSWEMWKARAGWDANSRLGTPYFRIAPYSLPGSGVSTLPAVDLRVGNLSSGYPSANAVEYGRTLPGINKAWGRKRYGGDKPNIGSKGCWDCYYREE